jgi:hypothetical protein
MEAIEPRVQGEKLHVNQSQKLQYKYKGLQTWITNPKNSIQKLIPPSEVQKT